MSQKIVGAIQGVTWKTLRATNEHRARYLEYRCTGIVFGYGTMHPFIAPKAYAWIFSEGEETIYTFRPSEESLQEVSAVTWAIFCRKEFPATLFKLAQQEAPDILQEEGFLGIKFKQDKFIFSISRYEDVTKPPWKP